MDYIQSDTRRGVPLLKNMPALFFLFFFSEDYSAGVYLFLQPFAHNCLHGISFELSVPVVRTDLVYHE